MPLTRYPTGVFCKHCESVMRLRRLLLRIHMRQLQSSTGVWMLIDRILSNISHTMNSDSPSALVTLNSTKLEAGQTSSLRRRSASLDRSADSWVSTQYDKGLNWTLPSDASTVSLVIYVWMRLYYLLVLRPWVCLVSVLESTVPLGSCLNTLLI